MRHFFSIKALSLLISLIPLICWADDSIPTTDLQEVVVKSERGWMENGVYNFIPSKKEKQLSNSPGSLIDVMNLPFLKGEGEAVMTSSGEPVTIFINGRLATRTDLATFWPKMAKKVEYMVNPSGGAYAGYRNVVNFVMTEYEVGGVTKANVLQRIPNNGSYRLASQLSYKRMTYGALAEYRYDQTRPSTSSEVTSYRDIFYDNRKYEEISQLSEQEQRNRNRNFNLALTALYQSRKFRAFHSLGLAWKRNPGSSVASTEEWSENLFDSDRFQSETRSKSLSPQVSGQYNYFILPEKFTMGGSWSYSFSDNDNDTWSRFGNLTPISNSIEEKVNAVKANLYFNYYFSRRFVMQLIGNGAFNWFSSVYGGSADEKSRQSRAEYSVQLTAFWQLSDQMNLVVRPGLMESVYRIDGTERKYLNPTAALEAAWNPNRKLNMRLGGQTWMLPAKSSSTNPVLIQSTDLLWLSGNPLLKPQITFSGDFTVDYMPLEWLSADGRVSYERQFHTPCNIYEAAPESMGGVIRTETNASPFDRINAAIGVRFRLLDGKLSVGATPDFTFFKSRGVYGRTLNNLSVTGSASYVLRNFRFSAFYQGKDTKLSPMGNEVLTQRDQFSLGVAYSFNDLYVRCEVQNLFHTRFKTSREANYDVYSVVSNAASTGRRLCLELTYTIGYGKKMGKNINVSGPSSVESSIISN